MWRASGWVCDERSHAVVSTMCSSGQARNGGDPRKQLKSRTTRTTTQEGNTNGSGTIVIVSGTRWLQFGEGRKNRVRCQTLEEKQRFVTFALKSVNHSTIHRTRTNGKTKRKAKDKVPRTRGLADKTIQWRQRVGGKVEQWPTRHVKEIQREEWAKFSRCYTHGGKGNSHISVSKIDDCVSHIITEHNREADHLANLGAEGQMQMNIDRKYD